MSNSDPSPKILQQNGDEVPLGSLRTPDLLNNPFYVLEATTRDDRKRIVELAEAKALELDHERCQQARAVLLNPRVRLGAEIGWLPGVSPKRSLQLLNLLGSDPDAIRKSQGIPTIAHANLLAAAFDDFGSEDTIHEISLYIQYFSKIVENIEPIIVMQLINEDRIISGFPELNNIEPIEVELSERKRNYKKYIINRLNELPSKILVEIMITTVDQITSNGTIHAPELIDEIVDSYEIECQEFLHAEAKNVEKIIEAIKILSPKGEEIITPLVDNLESVIKNWAFVSKPIQISSQSRGIPNEHSVSVLDSVRSLGIFLYNKHSMLLISSRITLLIKTLFPWIPEIADKIQSDIETLDEIKETQRMNKIKEEEKDKEMAYFQKFGMFGKNFIKISKDSIDYNGDIIKLNEITRVRWGGIRHSTNGIYHGTSYTIAYGNAYSEIIITIKEQSIYDNVIERLWKGVCIRIIVEKLNALKKGAKFQYGNCTIKDNGLDLVNHKIFEADEKISLTWDQIVISNNNGSLVIGSKDGNGPKVGLSYIEVPNIHIVEHIIRMAFKEASLKLLSELL